MISILCLNSLLFIDDANFTFADTKTTADIVIWYKSKLNIVLPNELTELPTDTEEVEIDSFEVKAKLNYYIYRFNSVYKSLLVKANKSILEDYNNLLEAVKSINSFEDFAKNMVFKKELLNLYLSNKPEKYIQMYFGL